MVVVDASALIAVLLGGSRAELIVERLADERIPAHAPHVVDLEVLNALRRAVRLGSMVDARAVEAIAIHQSFRLERHTHRPFLSRIWQLRHNITPYDAAYVALAEALDAPLLTCDGRLAGSTGHQARIELM